MQRFKNILLVYDDTEKGKSTLDRVVNLATRNQARLTIIDVIDGIPQDYQMLIAAQHPQEIMEFVVKKQKERLEQYIVPFLEAGLKVTTKVLVGKEFIEIIREVLRNNHDLVIKTARGKGGVRDILFGSIAMHLMRKCPCPVLVMKPGRSRRYYRILAAVDVTPSRPFSSAAVEVTAVPPSVKFVVSNVPTLNTLSLPILSYLLVYFYFRVINPLLNN